MKNFTLVCLALNSFFVGVGLHRADHWYIINVVAVVLLFFSLSSNE